MADRILPPETSYNLSPQCSEAFRCRRLPKTAISREKVVETTVGYATAALLLGSPVHFSGGVKSTADRTQAKLAKPRDGLILRSIR